MVVEIAFWIMRAFCILAAIGLLGTAFNEVRCQERVTPYVYSLIACIFVAGAFVIDRQ